MCIRDRVMVDGYDLARVSLPSYRSQLGIVLQDALIFSGTIRDNLLFGKPDASVDEIERAAEAACIKYFVESMPKGYNSEVTERGTNLSLIHIYITGIRVVKAFAREPVEIEKFARKNTEHYNANMERAGIEAKAQPFLEFLTGMSAVIMVGYGGYLVLSGQMTVGTLFAFYSLLWSLVWPVRMLGWLVNMAEQALAAAPRLFELLDTQPEIRDCPSPIHLPHATGHIAFEDVGFSFPGDDRETLACINLEILPGRCV